MIITSLDQIYAAIPNVKDIANELHSPCPFCKPTRNAALTKHNGVVFVGEDRFFWQENYKQFYCRQCGRHSLEEVVEKLFGVSEISADLQLEILNRPEKVKHELVVYNETYVEELHQKALVENRMGYFHSFGWSNETITKFRLGYGKLYPINGGASRYIIPFAPRTSENVVDGFALEGRLEHPYRNEPKNVKTAGLTREYFTEIIEGESTFAYICEGIKDGISAYEMGFRHIYCFFGNATDLDSFGKYIASKNYDTVVAFTHNDEAGEKYLKHLQEYLSMHLLIWPSGAKKGYDLTNLLEEYGDNASLYITQNLIEVLPEIPRGYVEDVRVLMPDYIAPNEQDSVSRDQIRQELPEVLDDFIRNYSDKRRMAGRGLIKILASDPGTGKSYALVRTAEELAKKALEEFNIEARALDTLIDQMTQETPFIFEIEALEEHTSRLERYKMRRANLSCATVLFAGPFITGWQDILDQGADENLWYNYEARNEDNCENLYAVTQLAQKGYVPMAYCQSVCPLKTLCERNGYLSQEAKRRQHPITYVRHQQLVTAMVQEYKYIIIDENCLGVFDTPTIIRASELSPTYPYWDAHVDPVQVKLILELVEALRVTLFSAEPNRVYSGRQVMQLLNDHLLGNLSSILAQIDPKSILDFQPKTVMQGIEMQTVPVRCLPSLFQVLLSELDLYRGPIQNYNSSLHIVNQEYEFYPLDRLHIPSNRPIIISDGTPLPELYELLFDREAEVYNPGVHNPYSQTIVYTGSDFTITSIRKQLGGALFDFQRWLEEKQKVVPDLYGEDFDLDEIPFDENIYNSSIMRRALSLIKMCAEKHSSLLFVTYKPIRLLLERRIKELYPELYGRIHFAHYWSLRGTNRFKDVEAVLLLGCPRVPYDRLYRRIQAWAKIAGMPWISNEIQLRVTPYQGMARYDGYTHPNFTDPFALRFVDMVEAGEVRQSQQRIRQHTSTDPKVSYLALARPSAKWVTAVDRIGATVNQYENSAFRDAYTHMQNYYLTNGAFPSYSFIANKYHLSNTKVSNIKRSILNVSRNKAIPS